MQYNHFICPIVYLLLYIMPFISMWLILGLFSLVYFFCTHSVLRFHLSSLFQIFISLSHLSSLLFTIYISYHSLFPCRMNNWWPTFESSGVVKGRVKSRGQHQYSAKYRHGLCTVYLLHSHRSHSLLMTYLDVSKKYFSLLFLNFRRLRAFIKSIQIGHKRSLCWILTSLWR